MTAKASVLTVILREPEKPYVANENRGGTESNEYTASGI